ncbi:uncharacterized protein LOC126899278 [Daktulosphaira vitifoliae]|uniref:uncharacterized protein LOC126899278 n=1 Tax=Daktulosphaira vitifoliae TaxID=58002 RepID=UPI0021A9CCD9|nr:uncharacterized protein LOC126899278 [Daktulosphaira vitifoliae]
MDQSNSSESIIDRDNHMIVDYPIESETTDINEVLKEQAVGHKSDPSKIKICDEFIESENKAKFELRNCQKSQYLLVQELRKLKSEAEIREDLLERGNEGFFIAENQKIKDENDALKNQIEGFKNEIYVLNSKYEGMEIEHKAKIKELREHFDDKIQKQLNDSQNVIKYLKESIEEINEEMKKRDLLCADAKKSLHERNLEVKEFKEINSMLQKKMAILKNKETQHEKKITFQESKIKDLNILNKNLKLDKESAQTLLNKSERDLETVIKEKEEQEAKYKELESNFKGTRQRNQELKILSEKRKREIERLCKCNPSNENDKNVSEWFKEKLERVEKREEELRIECGKKENEFKLRINEIKSEIKKLENSKIKLNHKNKELEMTVEGLKNAVKKKDEELYHLDNDYYHELTDKKKCEKMLIKKTKELKILNKRAFIFETEQREFRKKCAIKKTDTEKWINKNRTLTHGYKNHQKMRILREKELELSKLVLLIFMPTSNGARILSVLNIGAKSHWNFLKHVLKPLTDHGHHVTVFTPFKDSNRPNYTVIQLTNIEQAEVRNGIVEIVEVSRNPKSVISFLMNISRSCCDLTYEHEQMKRILSSGQNSGFDVLIVEPYSTECINHIASVLKIPMIYVIPTATISHMERSFTGNMLNPAYVGHIVSYNSNPSRTYFKRLSNFILFAYVEMQRLYHEFKWKLMNKKQYYIDKRIKPSIIFQNTHFITEPSRPFVQNLVQIGGIHLNPPGTIPKDILEFIDNSPDGVIYFTFGSIVFMSSLPNRIQKSFKDALSRVPQRILWKYEGVMDDKPDNVMTKEWFPQQDILSHPKVKLFISHGGISSIYEAVDAGVPVLGFPLFYEQPINIQNLVEAGMASSLDLLSVTEDSFYGAVMELINNKSYSKNAKIASNIFKDRPMSPAKSVVFWTEYVIRHNGAPHLKSNTLNLTWYQYFLLDVISVITIGLFIILYITKKLLRYLECLFLKKLSISKKL